MEKDDRIITSPLKAIRAYCLNCCLENAAEVKACPCSDCYLYPFRLGSNPYRKREMTEEQRKEAADRLRKARESKNTV